NGLRYAGKKLENMKLVCSGAGAAALACLNLLVSMGLPRENITVVDIEGVVYQGREKLMDPYKAVYAQDTTARTLEEVLAGADIFLGLSAPRVLKPEYLAAMNDKPFILALANPEPEILPELAKEARPDAIIATGRSDYPNQVNNVLCFPFLFRGALDVGATEINEAMKIACVEALADIATMEASDVVSAAYGGTPFKFGPEYLIPKPFDPRLMTEIPPRIAKTAMDCGVARQPIEDFHAYRRLLREFVFRSGLVMKPVFERAQQQLQRVVLAEGESRRVINALQVLVDDRICHPVLLGRPDVIEEHIRSAGLRLTIGEGFDVINPFDNPDFERYCDAYYNLMKRDGVSPDYAQSVIRTRTTALAAMMVRLGEADSMLCGAQGSYVRHLRYLNNIIGLRDGISDCSAIMLLILQKGTYFLADTHVSLNPSAEHIAETAVLGAQVVNRFGMVPRVALLSHSNFGGRKNIESEKMRKARDLLRESHPQLAVEGEMQADAALSAEIRERIFPQSLFDGRANLLLMPNLDAANIAYNMLKVLGDGLPVGPMLVGMRQPVHVMTSSVTVRGIVNMCAVAAVDAIDYKAGLAEAQTAGSS
ncbi:MAG: NADP-dependent malic enzyme, partial [Gammaproteobacteria bacterium]|nr:NADP-dependent malic enzyme [Gammaproteobacteria bacterium]